MFLVREATIFDRRVLYDFAVAHDYHAFAELSNIRFMRGQDYGSARIVYLLKSRRNLIALLGRKAAGRLIREDQSLSALRANGGRVLRASVVRGASL